MLTAIVDYESGNLHSAQKAFERVAGETGAGTVTVTSDPDTVRSADRIVLPGDGAFPACREELFDHRGLFEAIEEAVVHGGKPFLGICIGMQMMATRGLEYRETPGFDWIGGEVVRITPSDPALKVPHMGWNDLVIDHPHPVLEGLATGDHAYFVHSYHFRVADPADRLAHCDYGGDITAIVGKGTMIGTQFHPEKSQATGLRLIANFLAWAP
ncbi:MAG: imidazole glycerol phosphate synthase subunit HisH [Confluentimicrobium sp.]|jgi:imidazole glycerol-phosphate synthase subunit HisH|uniref:imidazole glycerol phosphate synthase subunit HisH n=1 Tax=Actibacterium sp. TaxID=1872125 RepID=UPI00050FBEB5|nr:imidazole glycerol phosphate synthase subunit HisH [Actibacterium sp.]KGB83411.1 imidazole glycerol phosphate synthase subunit HisH [Rhodovulum sp. NI22]MBC55778.1 imidazole glycerol phosphate synthase subunit HisH [Actibacterium sp.]